MGHMTRELKRKVSPMKTEEIFKPRGEDEIN